MSNLVQTKLEVGLKQPVGRQRDCFFPTRTDPRSDLKNTLSTVQYSIVAHLSNIHERMSVPTLRECLPFLSTSYSLSLPPRGRIAQNKHAHQDRRTALLPGRNSLIPLIGMHWRLSSFPLPSLCKGLQNVHGGPASTRSVIWRKYLLKMASEAKADPCTPAWPCCDQTSFPSYRSSTRRRAQCHPRRLAVRTLSRNMSLPHSHAYEP